MREQYEYTFTKCGLGPGPFADILRTFGKDGWELCGFQYNCAWFKRKVLPADDQKKD